MEYLIRRKCHSGILMTMYCPNCGALMVWKNGSIVHDPPTKRYECGYCEIIVTKYGDGSYETIKPNADTYGDNNNNTSHKKSSRFRKMLHIK
jgi:DNA-directed RNA polymerase subunit M/transcription elongation factor TFIIS